MNGILIVIIILLVLLVIAVIRLMRAKANKMNYCIDCRHFKDLRCQIDWVRGDTTPCQKFEREERR